MECVLVLSFFNGTYHSCHTKKDYRIANGSGYFWSTSQGCIYPKLKTNCFHDGLVPKPSPLISLPLVSSSDTLSQLTVKSEPVPDPSWLPSLQTL